MTVTRPVAVVLSAGNPWSSATTVKGRQFLKPTLTGGKVVNSAQSGVRVNNVIYDVNNDLPAGLFSETLKVKVCRSKEKDGRLSLTSRSSTLMLATSVSGSGNPPS